MSGYLGKRTILFDLAHVCAPSSREEMRYHCVQSTTECLCSRSSGSKSDARNICTLLTSIVKQLGDKQNRVGPPTSEEIQEDRGQNSTTEKLASQNFDPLPSPRVNLACLVTNPRDPDCIHHCDFLSILSTITLSRVIR